MDFISVTHSLDDTETPAELFKAAVNIPFSDKLRATELGLGIVVLLLVNDDEGTLDRIALSDTELASGAVAISAKPFHEIRIPLDNKENILNKVVTTNRYHITEDWAPMFIPELTPEEARFNQAGAGIACSVIYPLLSFGGVKPFGAMIFSYYEPRATLSGQHHAFMKAYADTVAAKLVAANAVLRAA
jgi:hypothetical protein